MGDWSEPELVRQERSAFSCITGWYPIGCHHLELTLAPGESRRSIFVLGYGKNERNRKFLPWIVCAEAELGRGDEAFDIYRRICPAYLEDKNEIHETEPYCYAQMVTGRASENPGHAKNSWLTGTASWTFLSLSQAILGIYPDYDGLRIQPCIPDVWQEYTILRRFRGTEYTIHVIRTGIASMSVNGVPVRGNVVPLTNEATVAVEVTLP